MDNLICDFCKAEFADLKSFHSHISNKHKTRIAEYYEFKFPRTNLLTGNPIKFKNFDQYFSQDFDDKNQLNKYFREKPAEAKIYAFDYLKKRFEDGKIIYAPGFVELKSLLSPNLPYYIENFDYTKLRNDIGLKFRFAYNVKSPKWREIIEIKNIIIDTREQKPLSFKLPIISECLKCGDYALKENDEGIRIERKSLADFVGTLSKGFERFEKELIRAEKRQEYIIMLVEQSIEKALSFNYMWECKHIKAQPAFIFHNLRSLLQKYRYWQPLFVEDRDEASNIIVKIFNQGVLATTYDLQWEYWRGSFKDVEKKPDLTFEARMAGARKYQEERRKDKE